MALSGWAATGAYTKGGSCARSVWTRRSHAIASSSRLLSARAVASNPHRPSASTLAALATIVQPQGLALEADVIHGVLQHDLVLADVVQSEALFDVQHIAARRGRQ